ncbi:phosphopantetheinyl transferase [Paenibacillus sp. OAE614]
MQSKIDEMLTHMSHSKQQMARVLDAERQVAVRMAQIIHDLPDEHPEFDGVSGLIDKFQPDQQEHYFLP